MTLSIARKDVGMKNCDFKAEASTEAELLKKGLNTLRTYTVW
jgi:predicted small metal-binding protein